MLEVKNKKGDPVDFQTLLHCYEAQNQNAWVNYLVYRDLRSRDTLCGKVSAAALTFEFMNADHTAKTPHLT